MINTNKVKLFEEFAAGEISNPKQNVTPVGNVDTTSTITVDKTVASGEQVRAEIIKDVDAILTNLETLSKRITEDVDKDFFFEGPINESLGSIIDFVKKQANFVKGMALINGDWKKLKEEGNADIIAAKEHDAIKKIDAQIDKMKRARDEAKGPKADAIKQKAIATIAKLKDNKADIDSKFEEAKEAARQALEEVEEKMKKYEDNMPGGTEGELYTNTKRKIGNNIKMEGLKEKGRIAKEKGKADAAKEAADELKKIGTRSKETDQALKELSADVDPKLEEQIKKIQKEIDREKDEDLAKLQGEIKSQKDKLSKGELEGEEKVKAEAQLEKLKDQEDKTLEGIYYLEDYLEELKAQRAALKGEDYDKAESKVGSTKDGEGKEKEGLGLMDEPKKAGKKPDSETVQKAKAAVKQAKAELNNDQEELAEIPKEIKDTEEDLKKAKDASASANPPNPDDIKKADDKIKKLEDELPGLMDKLNSRVHPDVMSKKLEIAQAKLTRAELGGDDTEIKDAKADVQSAKTNYQEAKGNNSQEEVEEAKSSDQEAAIKRAEDDVKELEKEIKALKDREKELKDDEIPQDQTNLKDAEAELKAAQSKDKKDRSEMGGTVDDIKKRQKDKLKSTKESKELSWDTLKEDLGLNQKEEKVHESFSIADKMRLILKR